jgi:predicted nucleotidyltransferase
VERAWTSTNLVLARWNFALAAAGNLLLGVKVDVAALAKNASQNSLADGLAQLVLGDVLPQTAKDALKPFAPQPAALAALLLASPVFQVRG